MRRLCAVLALLAGLTFAPAAWGATLAVSTTGSDSSACTPAAPCLSLDRAYQIANPGDTVEVAAGAYAGQHISADAGKPVGSAVVVIRPAVGAAVTLGSFSTFANDVHFAGFAVNDAATVRSGRNVTIQNFRATKPYVWGPQSGPAPDGVLFKGGVFVGNVGCSGGASAQFKSYQGTTDGDLPKNIVLDGIDLSGFELPAGCSGQPHQDCIHTFAVEGFTLRNSRIHGCEHFGILFGSTGDSRSDRVLIENNFFWDSGIADIRPRGDAPGVEQFDDVVVRNNSTEKDLIGTATYRNAVWQNNASVTAPNCEKGVTFGGNMSERGSTCSGDRRVSSVGYRDRAAGDFHLLAGSAPIDAAVGGHSATDIDGGTRDARPDVGADEFGVDGPSGAPAPGGSGAVVVRPNLSRVGNRLRIGRRGRVLIRLRCQPIGSSAPLRCLGVATLRAKVKRSGAPGRRLRIIGTAAFSIRPGHTAKVRVRLRRSGLRAVRRSGSLSARLSVTMRAPGGKSRKTARRVRLVMGT